MIIPVSGVELAKHTTLKIGGLAAYFVTVANSDDLLEVVGLVRDKKMPALFLGGGSNMLVSDEGFAGLVIKNEIKGIESEVREGEVFLSVASGESLDEVVLYTVEQGWWGIENLTSIPGTIGAAPVQNVGAYGVEIGDLIERVEVLDMRSGNKKIFLHRDCEFNYRDSFFKTDEGKNYFITNITLKLSTTPKPNIDYADLKKIFGSSVPSQKEVRAAVAKVRASKFPDWKILGTAGSFFKNPIIEEEHHRELLKEFSELPAYTLGNGMVKIPLGYVLDKLCDLKGYRKGAVGLSEAQALVLINYGGATAGEVKSFVQEVTEKVFAKTKIKIYPEVNFIN